MCCAVRSLPSLASAVTVVVCRRYTHRYGVKQEKFDQSLFLVFFQCIGNAIFALVCTMHNTQRPLCAMEQL